MASESSACVSNLFTRPLAPGQVLIAPSILSADFANMGDDCRAVLDSGADLLHLDVMDGHFVPNLTMGPALCRSLRKALPHAFLDVHLMVTDPAKFVRPFADAGANHFTFHVEVVADPRGLAADVHRAGMTAGLAINPPTPVERIVPFAGRVDFESSFDLILVMSVNPGFSGQAFIESVVEKTRVISALLDSSQRLEMDGGLSPVTAPRCVEAGCDVLVAASAVFGTPDFKSSIGSLRGGVGVKTG